AFAPSLLSAAARRATTADGARGGAAFAPALLAEVSGAAASASAEDASCVVVSPERVTKNATRPTAATDAAIHGQRGGALGFWGRASTGARAKTSTGTLRA